MISLICPNCHSRLKPKADYQVNPEDWIRCPACSELFHPQVLDPDVLGFDGDDPKASNPRKPRLAHEDLVQSLATDISKSYDRRSFGEGVDDLPLPPATPAKVDVARYFSHAIGALAGVALVSFLAIGFIMASPAPSQTPPPKAQRALDYAASLLAGDLRSLKNQMAKTKLFREKIEFRGPESRVYKYFSQSLGDEYCQDLSALNVRSDNTHKGFLATGVCLDEKSAAAQLSVAWTGDKAKVSLLDKNGGARVIGVVDLDPNGERLGVNVPLDAAEENQIEPLDDNFAKEPVAREPFAKEPQAKKEAVS
jgi:hypothetical protein